MGVITLVSEIITGSPSLNSQPLFGSCPGSHGLLPKKTSEFSDVTTRKPGGDFDGSIILFLHNYA